MKIVIMKPLQLLISLLLIFPVATLANEPTLLALKPKYVEDDLRTFVLHYWPEATSGTGYIVFGSSGTFKVTYTDMVIRPAGEEEPALKESHIRIHGTFKDPSGNEYKHGLYYFFEKDEFFAKKAPESDLAPIDSDTELVFQFEESTEGRVPPYTVIEYFDWKTIESKIGMVAQQNPESIPVASDSSIPCDPGRVMPFMVSIDNNLYNLDSSFTGISPVKYLTGQMSEGGKIYVQGADKSEALTYKKNEPGFPAQILDVLFIRVQALGVCQEDPGTASPYMSWLGLQEGSNRVYNLE